LEIRILIHRQHRVKLVKVFGRILDDSAKSQSLKRESNNGMKMKYNSDIHHRRSIRLNGYDYSQTGLYFITICTQNRLCLFGEIKNWEMILNDAGMMIDKWWNELKHKYRNIKLHEQIIMPNHFHGIVQTINETDPVGADLRVCPDDAWQTSDTGKSDMMAPTDTEELCKRQLGKHIGLPAPTYDDSMV